MMQKAGFRDLWVVSLSVFGAIALVAASSGCMTAYKKSVGADTQEVYRRVYATDFNMAWQAVLDSLKSLRLDVSNRESGQIITRWQDNTAERNFVDGAGTVKPYMKAQFRFKLGVAKGFYNGVSAIQVTVQKEQLVQRDALDDPHPNATDSIEEKTLLYRIGRLITLRTKLAKLEEQRTNLEIENATGAAAGGSGGDLLPPATAGDGSTPATPPPLSTDESAPPPAP